MYMQSRMNVTSIQCSRKDMHAATNGMHTAPTRTNLCNHTIINNASFLICEDTKCACAVIKAGNVSNYQRLKQLNGIFALQKQ